MSFDKPDILMSQKIQVENKPRLWVLCQNGVIELRSFSGVSEECLRGVFRLLEECLKISCSVWEYLLYLVLFWHQRYQQTR